MITLHLAYAAPRFPRPVRPAAHVVVEVGRAAAASPALGPVPLARDLTAPLTDGVPHRERALRRSEAERGFSEGTFYLPGQIVDRRA